MTIKKFQKEVHELAKEKGWWDKKREALEIHALIHSEIGEATEEVRTGNTVKEFTELADAIIRILDYAQSQGIDMEELLQKKHNYNKTRSYRHGGKLK